MKEKEKIIEEMLRLLPPEMVEAMYEDLLGSDTLRIEELAKKDPKKIAINFIEANALNDKFYKYLNKISLLEDFRGSLNYLEQLILKRFEEKSGIKVY